MLLTGIHLMQSGRVEANLLTLNQEFRLPWIPDLVNRKIFGKESSLLEIPEIEFHRAEYKRLVAQLEAAAGESKLPDAPAGVEALNDLLIRVRLRRISSPA